jgi:hypothetical protein
MKISNHKAHNRNSRNGKPGQRKISNKNHNRERFQTNDVDNKIMG